MIRVGYCWKDKWVFIPTFDACENLVQNSLVACRVNHTLFEGIAAERSFREAIEISQD